MPGRKARDKGKDYSYEARTTKRSDQTGNGISDRNNNMNAPEPTANEPDMERANDLCLGEAAVNDRKMTK